MRTWLFCLVAACTGATTPQDAATCDLDPALTTGECAALHELLLPLALPPARGNAVADELSAAQLGFQLFFDARFSANEEFRCATCHAPEAEFADARPVAMALGTLTRNTPTVLNAARRTWLFWDGRADTLWAQPLFALEKPTEMDFTRLEVAHRVFASYRPEYERVFGPLPDLADAQRFPARGTRGDVVFEGMTQADQEATNRVAANVGKAIEAYLRRLASGRAPLDRFLEGERDALTPAQRRGMGVFARAGCLSCHSGPMLTDEQFHNVGVPAWPGVEPDRGREDGLTLARESELNAYGPYYEGPPPEEDFPEPAASDLGAFRTPSLRNVAETAPYGHNGRFATLEEMVSFLLGGGGHGGVGYVGEVDPLLVPIALTPDESADLVAFLRALDGDKSGDPWNYWPSR
jgi:cytochrome c peroxidase